MVWAKSGLSHKTPDTKHRTQNTGHKTPDTKHWTQNTVHRTPDNSRLASVCAPRVASWCPSAFPLSRLRANRGAHARKFRACVEKGWGPPPPFPLTLTALTTQRGHLGHSDHKHPVRGLLGHFDPGTGGEKKRKCCLSQSASTSVSMNQCVHHDQVMTCYTASSGAHTMTFVMTYCTASSGATPRRQTSDSPCHSVHV